MTSKLTKNKVLSGELFPIEQILKSMMWFGIYFTFHSVCLAGLVCLQMAVDWPWRTLHYKGFVMKQLTIIKNRAIADYLQVNETAFGQANILKK